MSRVTPLTMATVSRRRGTTAPKWHRASDLNLSELHIAEAPPIGIVTTRDSDKVAGRFFPRVTCIAGYPGPIILIYRHDDDAVTRATAVHELCHFTSYCEECGHVPQNRSTAARCRYKGEHDAEFYQRLEPMYRAAGVPTYAARAVEGTYDYPEHWKESEWP